MGLTASSGSTWQRSPGSCIRGVSTTRRTSCHKPWPAGCKPSVKRLKRAWQRMGGRAQSRRWTKSTCSSLAGASWSTWGGRGVSTMCSPWPARRWGGDGLKRCSRRCCRGNSTRPARVARDTEPKCSRRCRPCKPHVRRLRALGSWRPMGCVDGWRSVPRPCSRPHRPPKVDPASWRRCITVSVLHCR